MIDHIANRIKIIQAVKEELVGPAPQGEEIDCNKEIILDLAASYRPYRQKDSGEEILQDQPGKRYGVGVLYPLKTPAQFVNEEILLVTEDEINNEDEIKSPEEAIVTEKGLKLIEEIEERINKEGDDNEKDDLDLSIRNAYKPSSIGISFLAEFPKEAKLIVKVSGARYLKKKIQILNAERTKERNWWLRIPLTLTAIFSSNSIYANKSEMIKPEKIEISDLAELKLHIEVFARPMQDDYKRLITVCLINREETSSDESSLFQTSFTVSIVSADSSAHILPYPGPPAEKLDDEELSLTLLYRNTKTYAVGHSCAADWSRPVNDRVSWLSAECLPLVETPSITPDIKRADGTPMEVSMADLAGLTANSSFEALTEIIELYEKWIDEQNEEIAGLEDTLQSTAQRHLTECSRSVARMRAGLDYLTHNAQAQKAFRLANHAILLQQLCSRREPRKISYDSKTFSLHFSEPYQEPDIQNNGSGRGKWRAFQIAFLLMTVYSTAEVEAPDRETVELIWFPTGGGKTEAYLGLTAYAIFMRRLKDANDDGVQVLMRYTLRLLTAQQFQRAAGLLCGMEYLRRKDSSLLGEKEFSIGIWLGGSTTPNTCESAIKILTSLQKGNLFAENQFILTRCPWCNAQIGPMKYPGKTPSKAPLIIGYEQQAGTVVFKCSDKKCVFRQGLPIYVIDEDIYTKRPSLVIGTVDKFAMLAWKPEARAIFGIDAEGERKSSPPGLIIQDELHLISGPLGSMVGLYETVIEELCTDRRYKKPIAPKLVTSTATIRRYAEQIKAIYGREDVALFPSPGLKAEDSFFARYATNSNGELAPGRIYLGVHAPGLGSLQTAETRTVTALLQAPNRLTSKERDPWWTLLMFFNTLKELGTSLSLLQSRIPDYFLFFANRTGQDRASIRRLRRILELTGRLRSDEVPTAIANLEVSCESPDDEPIDICLASNIIEVGVDIDRLSLMTVVGQPKTTSQYIQVTGRVGRRWWERPGLVVTLYGAAKPRDRSHFEKFRSYHEKLYAQVEPTSVTPFSAPALDRALHAIIAVYVRQKGNSRVAKNPYPCPVDFIKQLQEILLKRIEKVDPEEVPNFKKVFKKRLEQWKAWERRLWSRTYRETEMSLLREAGAYVARPEAKLSWPTLLSMRNVDAECQIEITRLYLDLIEEESIDD